MKTTDEIEARIVHLYGTAQADFAEAQAVPDGQPTSGLQILHFQHMADRYMEQIRGLLWVLGRDLDEIPPLGSDPAVYPAWLVPA